jgi:hypothetical protein
MIQDEDTEDSSDFIDDHAARERVMLSNDLDVNVQNY